MDPTLLTAEDIKRGIEIGKRVVSLWERIATAVGGNKSQVMLTGMQGVGKTVLFDYMTGKAYRSGYKPPSTSRVAETGKLGKTGLLVVPGQSSAPRFAAVQSTLLGKRPPMGIIHVVANGFASIRGEEATRVLQKTARIRSIESLRSLLLRQEEEDLGQICEWIRIAHRSNRHPAWLMLAITKYDLFASDTGLGQSYFPGGSGKIAKQLELLTTQIGSDHFRWQAANVCGNLEP